MREWCQFWVDKGQYGACCQTADPDVLSDEHEAFDCETCDLAQAQRNLDADNSEAWRVFHLCGRRVAVEWRMSGVVLGKITERMTVEETTDLVERLDVILAELFPPKAEA